MRTVTKGCSKVLRYSNTKCTLNVGSRRVLFDSEETSFLSTGTCEYWKHASREAGMEQRSGTWKIMNILLLVDVKLPICWFILIK